VLLLLLFPTHGGVGVDPVGGHAGASIGPCEQGLHDGSGACNLSCA
jgi:hypothetical protein